MDTNDPDIFLINLGSSAQNPNIDWSQLQETISLLCLAMAQIESSRSDSTKSIEALMSSFFKIAEESVALEETCEKQLEKDDSSSSRELCQRADTIKEEVGKAVVALQYHDRLSQKLGHVTVSLKRLGELINDRSRIFIPDEWVKIQHEIQQHYTLDCERLMFDLILDGVSLDEALKRYHENYDQLYNQGEGSQGQEAELF